MPESPPKSTFTAVAGLGWAVAALLFFSWLATNVAFGGTLAFDHWGRELVHSHANPALTSTMRFVTLFGTPGFMVPLGACICSWLFRKGLREEAWLFIVSVTGGFILDITLKSAFGRARPEPFFGTPLPASAAFPSGHALFSVCFYFLLALLAARRAREPVIRYAILALGAILAVLIGLSRVYLGVHYPSDVLAGYAAATVWVSSLSLAGRWHRRRRERRESDAKPRAA